jgi:hypothetical protein
MNINREFGSGPRPAQPVRPVAHPLDPDLMTLVERVRSFDYDNATESEQALVVKALKTIAADTVARFDHVLALQHELEGKLRTTSFCAEVSEVIARIKPAKKGLWRR